MRPRGGYGRRRAVSKSTSSVAVAGSTARAGGGRARQGVKRWLVGPSTTGCGPARCPGERSHHDTQACARPPRAAPVAFSGFAKKTRCTTGSARETAQAPPAWLRVTAILLEPHTCLLPLLDVLRWDGGGERGGKGEGARSDTRWLTQNPATAGMQPSTPMPSRVHVVRAAITHAPLAPPRSCACLSRETEARPSRRSAAGA